MKTVSQLRSECDAASGIRWYADQIRNWAVTSSTMPLMQRRVIFDLYENMQRIGIYKELPYLVRKKWELMNNAPNYNKKRC